MIISLLYVMTAFLGAAVLDDDTAESLHARIQEQEHIAYPEALRAIAKGTLQIKGRRVVG